MQVGGMKRGNAAAVFHKSQISTLFPGLAPIT